MDDNLSDMECGCCLVSPTREDFLPLYVAYNFKKQESSAVAQRQISYKNNRLAVRSFEVLDHLRKDKILCDVELETDDGVKVYAHKVILVSATPYFQAMFTNFKESNTDSVILRELNSAALKLLVDYIYTSQIMITEDNVQDLLQAASLLQVHDVRNICCDFLLTHLNSDNCLNIKELVSLYGSVECLPNFKAFIRKNFTMVVRSEEFLCLRYEELVELISSNDLNVPSEEIVFECVIKWVNHDSSCRKDFLPKLMKHVRLSLVSYGYVLKTVLKKSIMGHCFTKTEDYLLEVLRFKSEAIPKTSRTKHRKHTGSSKIVLFVGKMFDLISTDLKWYDPSTKIWELGPQISTRQGEVLKILCVLNNQTMFCMSKDDDTKIMMIDLFSSYLHLQKSVPLLQKRSNLGVGVLDNCIYAVGGSTYSETLKSAEVFNLNTQKWKLISEMSTRRSFCGVGVLNNHLYAVGGFDCCLDKHFKSVERYCPKTDTWTPVRDMNVSRCGVGVGVLNGILYAVGGNAGARYLNWVEAYNPSSNTWTFVSCMNKYRSSPGVVALDGLLYVFSGDEPHDFEGVALMNYSVETYNPKTDVWSILTKSELNSFFFSGAVVIDKPSKF